MKADSAPLRWALLGCWPWSWFDFVVLDGEATTFQECSQVISQPWGVTVGLLWQCVYVVCHFGCSAGHVFLSFCW